MAKAQISIIPIFMKDKIKELEKFKYFDWKKLEGASDET